MSRKRLSKKQLKGDRFVRQTFDWAHWLETHRNQALAGLAVVVLLAAGLYLWRRSVHSADEAASVAYLEARQSYFAGNYPLAANDLQGFLARYGDTAYADDATFFMGDAFYQAGQYPEAIRTLERLLAEHADSPFAGNGRRLLAASYQQAGQLPQAIAIYQRALEEADTDPARVDFRNALARIYEAQGDREAAANQYRAIVELDPSSDAAREARRRLAEVSVEPSGSGAATSRAAPADTAAPGPAPLGGASGGGR